MKPPASGAAPLVRVALPRGVEQLFTYRVPAGQGTISPGTRVLVPFGRERLTGLVVEEGSEDDLPSGAVKDIELVLDERPTLPPSLLALGRFIADYYLVPLGEVLRAMHPGGPAGTVVVRLTEEGRVALEGRLRGTRRRAVLEALRTSDRTTLTGLRRRLGITGLPGVLRDLQAAGWLTLSVSLSAGPQGRVLKAWSASAIPPADRDDAAVGRSAARRVVLDLLRGATGALTAAELAAELSLSREKVRTAAVALASSGLLEETKRRVRRRPEAPLPSDVGAARRDAGRRLTDDQARVFGDLTAMIDAASFDTLLLEGVTGSGKTEVYLRALALALERGRTGLYLVPEISITPLLLRTVRARFGERTAVLHSGLSRGERHDERQRILDGEVDLVLGARSAVFAPLSDLGLIVVDEEHEGSYKQDTSPRYHARDVAIMRGRLEGVPVVLGSATPSLESHRNAMEGRYQLRRMPNRIGDSRHAVVELVDMRAEDRGQAVDSMFSRRLREALDQTLNDDKQALILLNRRGWADYLLCRECGEPERCEHCAVTLTVHLKARRLTCHYCDLQRDIPEACRQCGGSFLQLVGQGTEQLETALKEQLEGVPVSRLDRDIARRKGAAAKVLSDFEAGRTRVLVGTQMIAKGHDFPGVTLVGVLQADRALWLPDFRSAERAYQLLTQVAGRAGRRSEPGRVIVQTYSPDHPALAFAAKQEFRPFYESEAATREALAYPPFVHLIGLLISGEDQGKASAHAEDLARVLREEAATAARVLGPAPAPMPRLRDRWRFQVLVKSRTRKGMKTALRKALARLPAREGVSLDVDVDPQSLL